MASAIVPQALAWEPCSLSANNAPDGVIGHKRKAAEAALTQDHRGAYSAGASCSNTGSHAQCSALSDDACSSDCSSGESECSKVVAVRRYCIIFAEDVPEAYFASGDAVREVDALVRAAAAELRDAGLSLLDTELARGVDAYNVKAEEGEMWCNIPEACVAAVLEGLGGKAEDVFEDGFDFGFDDDDDDD